MFLFSYCCSVSVNHALHSSLDESLVAAGTRSAHCVRGTLALTSHINSSPTEVLNAHTSDCSFLSMNADTSAFNVITRLITIRIHTSRKNTTRLVNNSSMTLVALAFSSKLDSGLHEALIAVRQPRVRERQLLWVP